MDGRSSCADGPAPWLLRTQNRAPNTQRLVKRGTAPRRLESPLRASEHALKRLCIRKYPPLALTTILAPGANTASYASRARHAITDPFPRIAVRGETDQLGRSIPAEEYLSWLRFTHSGVGYRQGRVGRGMEPRRTNHTFDSNRTNHSNCTNRPDFPNHTNRPFFVSFVNLGGDAKILVPCNLGFSGNLENCACTFGVSSAALTEKWTLWLHEKEKPQKWKWENSPYSRAYSAKNLSIPHAHLQPSPRTNLWQMGGALFAPPAWKVFSLPPRKPPFAVLLQKNKLGSVGLPRKLKIHTGRRDSFRISRAFSAEKWI